MRVIVDMNLSPSWVEALEAAGFAAVHWSSVGDPRDSDEVVLSWARKRGHVVLTHDLDFGYLLALAGESGPSVVQIRAQDVLPKAIGERVITALRQHADSISAGALVVIDPSRSRVRILPISD